MKNIKRKDTLYTVLILSKKFHTSSIEEIFYLKKHNNAQLKTKWINRTKVQLFFLTGNFFCVFTHGSYSTAPMAGMVTHVNHAFPKGKPSGFLGSRHFIFCTFFLGLLQQMYQRRKEAATHRK